MTPILTSTHARAVATAKAAWEAEALRGIRGRSLGFSDDWADPEFEPDIAGLPNDMAAELRLRFASLLGYQGHLRKIQNSQRRACAFCSHQL